MMNVGAIIQARLSSTRSKEKILRNLGGRPMLSWVLERACQLLVDTVILAVPDTDAHDALLRFAGDRVILFKGDEEDVLQRFIDAAQTHHLDVIVRICADDPFIDPALSNALIKKHLETNSDYTTYALKGKPTILTHSVVYPEVVSLAALQRAAGMTKDLKVRQHVTMPIYANPSQFTITFLPLPIYWQRTDIRLTLDTDEDFLIQEELVRGLDHEGREPTPQHIARYLDSHPLLLAKMKKIISEHQKKIVGGK